MAAILAISAAFFWGLSEIFTSVGLRYTNVLSGLVITIFSSLIISIVISLFTVPLKLFANPGVLFFLSAGIIGTSIGRLLFFEGIKRVGASIASPLAATRPLFAAIASMMILGERITFPIALGTILIIIGIGAIVSEKSGGQIETKWSKRDLIFPILAGVCYGIANVIRKIGLNFIPEPLVGVTIQNATALSFFPLLTITQQSHQNVVLNNKRAWLIFCSNGLLMLVAHLFNFSALHIGQVVIVTPLSSVSSFFVLLLASVFLKKLERVTLKIVLGSSFIIGGAIILTVLTHS